jgi:polysaccharide biosynthesis protein PslG
MTDKEQKKLMKALEALKKQQVTISVISMVIVLMVAVTLVVTSCGGGGGGGNSAANTPPTDAPAADTGEPETDDTADTPDDSADNAANEPADNDTQPIDTTDPTTDTQPIDTTDPTTDTQPVAATGSGAPVHMNGTLQTPYLEFGVVPHLYYTDHERVLQLTKNAGFGWVRQQIVWKDMEMAEPEFPDQPESRYVWDQLDPIVEAVNAYDLKLLISIVQSPPFYNPTNGLPEDPADLGNFVQAMAERYGDQIDAYEIWNEQNLAHETGGTITVDDVGHYVEILMEGYQRIKAVNPEAYVLAGAPSSTGVTDVNIALSDMDYYEAMYTYKDGIIKDYFDVQAVHPGGSANPPDTLWPENPSTADGWTDHSTFYFRHIEHVREVMEAYGMNEKQIWITEYGWATENNTPGYEFGNQVSFETQSDYITGAIQYTYDNYPWVGNMFLWNMNFAVTWAEHDPPNVLHEQASFGILNPDWSPRPAYIAIQELLTRLKAEQGRP